MADTDFAALLCSRLCHDLISPVGAIANGIEILAEEDDEMMRQEVIKLLEQSSTQTSARLQFYRLAFGSAGGFGENVPLEDAEKAVKGLFGSSNIELKWQPQVFELNKDAVKLLLNLVLIAGESLIRGGKLLLDIQKQDETTVIEITVHGDRIILQDKIRDILTGASKEEPVEPKTAPASLAVQVCEKLNAQLNYIIHNEQSFSFKAEYTS